MARACGIIALLSLTLSAAFHFATFFPAISVTMQMVWPLHLVTMAVFATMVFSVVAQQRRHSKKSAKGAFANWRAASQQNREFQSKLIGFAPCWLRVACGIAFVHAFVNFAQFIVLMEGGSPSVENGKYYLHSHGRTIRDISKEEFERFQEYEVRGFSGHWMVFSIVPMTYFLTVHPRLRESNESDQPS